MFDQAAFDAIHGANTFPLADFLAFKFSSGVVPEPGATMFFMLCSTLALTRRRR